jgi:hypothetical protein
VFQLPRNMRGIVDTSKFLDLLFATARARGTSPQKFPGLSAPKCLFAE